MWLLFILVIVIISLSLYFHLYIIIVLVVFILFILYWLPKCLFTKNGYLCIAGLNCLSWKNIITKTNKNFHQKTVALTFDDIPTDNFEELIQLLDSYNIKATFFMISRLVNNNNNNLLIKAIQNGHQICNHGRTDSLHALKSEEAINYELNSCAVLIDKLYEEANVNQPLIKYYRPGGGFFSSNIMRYAQNNNYKITLGSVYPNDPKIYFPYVNYLYLKYHIEAGDIIILHDRPWTVPMLNLLIPWLIENNFQCETLANFL